MSGFLFPVHGEETVEEAKADREARMAAVARQRVVNVGIDEIYKSPGLTDAELFAAMEASGEVRREGGKWFPGKGEA